jgi:hypothetical protein
MPFADPTAHAIARPVPTGVASDDGRQLYLRGAAGIDAVDVATGATAWSTSAASLPVIALPGAVIALRAQVGGDRWWTGRAELVAIDLAAPHAVRTGGGFELPERHGELAAVWCEARVLHARWVAVAAARGIAPSPGPVEGELRVDLERGTSAVEPDAPSPVPPAITAALHSLTTWYRGPWRTLDGWSAVVTTTGDDGLVATLKHWTDAGGERSAAIVSGALLLGASPLAADARDLIVRVCDGATPARCAIRIHAADTGALVAELPDPAPPEARLEPPMARVDRTLLATRDAGGVRELVAMNLDASTVAWRRAIPAPASAQRRPAPAGRHGG